MWYTAYVMYFDMNTGTIELYSLLALRYTASSLFLCLNRTLYVNIQYHVLQQPYDECFHAVKYCDKVHMGILVHL